MEDKKTISYLNSKRWYRTIKVIFILIFILICVGIVWSIFDAVGEYQEDYLVRCNFGSKETFLAYKDKGIYLLSYGDYSESLADLPNFKLEELQNACLIKPLTGQSLLDNLNGKKLFDLEKTKINVFTYWKAFYFSLLYVTITLVIFEIIRRIFYYIYFGKLIPKK